MTTTAIATTSSAPIAKLYRMCGVYNAHAKCKGSFETHSVCNCACHKTPAAPARQQRAVKVAAPVKAKRSVKAPVRYSQPAAPTAQVYSKAEIDARIDDLCKLVRSLRSLPVR